MSRDAAKEIATICNARGSPDADGEGQATSLNLWPKRMFHRDTFAVCSFSHVKFTNEQHLESAGEYSMTAAQRALEIEEQRASGQVGEDA